MIRSGPVGLRRVRVRKGARDGPLSLKAASAADARLGPGKADLLQGIEETGSIAAAGRRMGMSCKRAWQLVGTLNACFAKPAMTTTRDGASHGAAALTATGRAVPDRYRRMRDAAERAVADDMARPRALVRPEGAGPEAVAPSPPPD